MDIPTLRALRKAHKASQSDGRLRFIYHGRVYLRRDPRTDTICTNGTHVCAWAAGSSRGRVDEDLTSGDLIAYVEAQGEGRRATRGEASR